MQSAKIRPIKTYLWVNHSKTGNPIRLFLTGCGKCLLICYKFLSGYGMWWGVAELVELRCPTTVTAKSFTQDQINLATAKINFITAKSFSHKAKYISHGKIVSIHGKTILANFPLDISSQSTMGVNQTWWSSSWFHDSTCIAQTVEIVCLQRHISACSLDKVNRSWWMHLNTLNWPP